ncbi:cation transporter [Solirubrobacter sp. CPCC 204708]|uniref:Cation transporter n=1 Tax=Solirubrobacter deserti TaxID=2282478 RepID=A0ABT4RCK3_9ACTN|nr:cation transporter [Solirubrobacter deserti]MBE2315617.1 cation transporter [Solirubrobacter deserti]MDA0136256.1 cation transporter [Solirubrobacter deserti]
MRYPPGVEIPPELDDVYRRAVRLEWITVAYLISAVVAIYFTLGSSQAMKGAWLEDLLSLAPPIAFLIADRIRYRRPDKDFPYGYHRALEVAFLAGALALLITGLYLIFDSVLKLLAGEHAPIGMVELFDWQVWLGWLMIAALLWSAIPVLIIGRIKTGLALKLHDKVLNADAAMNRADWMTAGAALVGVIGIGFGVWWLDAAAAIVIGADITRDGWKYTRAATADLVDGRPRRLDESGVHALVGQVHEVVGSLDWVEVAAVRMRELGHVISVSVLAVPRAPDDPGLLDHVEDAVQRICTLDWKLQDVVVAVVRELDEAPEDILVRPRSNLAQS